MSKDSIPLVGDEFGRGRHGRDTQLGDLAIVHVSGRQEQDAQTAFLVADIRLGARRSAA
jgi:hypothetical protein